MKLRRTITDKIWPQTASLSVLGTRFIACSAIYRATCLCAPSLNISFLPSQSANIHWIQTRVFRWERNPKHWHDSEQKYVFVTGSISPRNSWTLWKILKRSNKTLLRESLPSHHFFTRKTNFLAVKSLTSKLTAVYREHKMLPKKIVPRQTLFCNTL